MGKTLIVNGQKIVLPDKYRWVLFRHGEKTNQSPTRGGELTPLGRKQVWDTTWQLIEKVGQETMERATILHSPVYRVEQSRDILMAAAGLSVRYAKVIEQVPLFEWGPDNGHTNDASGIRKLINHTDNNIVIAMGHNGLWEYVAQIIHRKEDGYSLPAGAAFIITENGIEMITPRVTA